MNLDFPTTRYQGSKRRLLDWIAAHVRELPFETCLDAFGGTGAVSYLFKRMGKTVTYNDVLASNHQIGLALIENRNTQLSDADIAEIFSAELKTDGFISRTFDGIYFTADENRWLDAVVPRIDALTDTYTRAIARFALIQACLAKRPYNLFHRANLALRQADVSRSFGNKSTWDTPFDTLFRRYAAEANAAVFDNGRANRAICTDALHTPTGFDLVYLDPPYVSARGVGVDYAGFYHFLEGLMDIAGWAARIDTKSKHRRMNVQPNVWANAKTVTDAFAAVVDRHRDSILAISYRADGIPSVETLISLLKSYKRDVRVFTKAQQYALSTRQTEEVLLIGV